MRPTVWFAIGGCVVYPIALSILIFGEFMSCFRFFNTTLMLFLAASPVSAKIYKCDVGGKKTYQSEPCYDGKLISTIKTKSDIQEENRLMNRKKSKKTY